MLKVGVIRLGVMGLTHVQAYARTPDVRVVAVADERFGRKDRSFDRAGNIAGQGATEIDLSGMRQYRSAQALIDDPEVQAVDICVPTPQHHEMALAALSARKHVLVEKPMARTSAQAREMALTAQRAGVVLMPAHCLRFWPGWTWLKASFDSARYGAVLAARFTRLGARPEGAFYRDAAACGGALVDMHVHDSDFVRHLFGMPRAVTSLGYVGESGAVDHVVTRYHYDDGKLVLAEGAWIRTAGRPFEMRYLVQFETATVDFEFGRAEPLLVYREGSAPEAVPLPDELGYAGVIAEFVRCARAGGASSIVSADDGVEALRLVEAELESLTAMRCIEL